MILWLYGRSGAGKTTLAVKLEDALRARGLHAFLLDGDLLRAGLCSDLGFGEDARTENHRRAAEMAKLIAARNIVVIAATMAPQYAQRDAIHNTLGDTARWVYVDAPFEICAQRDPKGLYAKAAAGEIKKFNNFPFDPPRTSEVDLHLHTDHKSIDQTFTDLLTYALSQTTNPQI
ncbi:MAG: adenylyl-sulfate kinase [Verrucomicrobiales bacterium]|nr:adenylyl-sulfate kinase [Verrucomicrobiales bacterium]